MNINSPKNIILVIDDNATNIMVLVDCLKIHGFETITARNGAMGIRRAQFSQPDLILLDIKMAEMDGYEVCKRLKADEQTRYIPIIFISALSETFDKVKAFAVGGVDYVTKPFQKEEVLARVKTHLALQAQQKQLQTQAEKLQQANEQLVQLNQEKNEFLGIAVHDLKNPLSAILGTATLVEKSIKAEQFASKANVIKYANWIKGGAEHMFNIITNLLEVNAIDSGKIKLKLGKNNILPVLSHIVVEYTQKAKCKDITLDFTPANREYIAYVDINRVRQILDNLVSNAVKYSPFGKNVYIRILTTENATICCEIKDEGLGLSHEEQAKLFKKFSSLSPRPTNKENSTGLGLFIVKKLVTAMGGKVWCESELGKGSKFVVEFMQ
ncbi:MAG: hybrid sensor histidine kinase/response regulator [Pseudomonadota bacterium]